MTRGAVFAAATVLAATCMVRPALGDACHSGAGDGTSESHTPTCAADAVSEKPVCTVCAEPLGPRPVQLRGEPAQAFDCIFCALVGAKRPGDVTLTASSQLSGKAVTLTRKEAVWKAVPTSAVALALPSPAHECGDRRLVFATADEFAAYVKARPALARQQPKAIPLAKVEQIIEAGRPPLPDEAVCPVAKRTIVPDRKTEWTIANGEVHYFCCAGCKSGFEQ